MLIKSQYRNVAVGMSSRVRNSKKCDFSLAWKLDIELALQMPFGSKFQTDVWGNHAERSFGCLGACPRHRKTRNIGGPQRPRRHLAL